MPNAYMTHLLKLIQSWKRLKPILFAKFEDVENYLLKNNNWMCISNTMKIILRGSTMYRNFCECFHEKLKITFLISLVYYFNFFSTNSFCRIGKHKCIICGEAFYQKDMLKRHVLSFHNEVTSFRGRSIISKNSISKV